MEKYNYTAEVANEIENWMDSMIDPFDLSQFEDREDAAEFLHDELWDEDSITGNGENGYADEYFCEECLCHNFDLLFEACNEFCVELDTLIYQYQRKRLARFFDCTIRCYVLGEAIDLALRHWEEYDGTAYKEKTK